MVAANYVWSYRLPDKSRAIFCVKENRSAIRVGVRFPTVSWNISNNLTRFSSADNPLGAYTCEGECRVILSKLTIAGGMNSSCHSHNDETRASS